MPKSMDDFKVRGGPEKRNAKVTKLREFRQMAARARDSFEKYWLRDQEDLNGYVDNSDSKKFPYKSRLRIPYSRWMANTWRDNWTQIILDEDHPIEITGREGVSIESLFTRQAMMDDQLFQSGFSTRYDYLTQNAVEGGSGIWKVVRHVGKSLRTVKEPVIDKETGQITGTTLKDKQVPFPYYGVGVKEVSKWNLYPDPSADNMNDCGRIVEKAVMSKAEIERRWPDTKKIPDKANGKDDLAWENFPPAAPSDDHRQEYDLFSKLNHTVQPDYGNPDRRGPTPNSRYTVYIMWDAEEDEIIVTLADTYLLHYSNLEMGDKRLPFVMQRFNRWDNYFWGRSLPQTIHTLSKAADCIFNMHMDVTQMQIHPAYIVSRMAQANVSDLRRGVPGAIIHVLGSPDLIKQMDKGIPAGVAAMEEVQFIYQMLQLASNVNNLTTGSPSQGFNRTATGVVTLTQQAQNGFVQAAKRASSECLEPLGNKFNDAIDVMFDKPKVISIVGMKGQSYVRRWTYDEMIADVQVRPKRLRDHSEKSMEAQLWMQLIQGGITQDPNVSAGEVYKRLFVALGQRDLAKLLPEQAMMLMQMRQPVDPAQSLSEVMAEHRQLIQSGRIVPPKPDEDDKAHKALHNQFMQSGSYQGLQEDAQAALWEHITVHEMFDAAEQQINAALQTQQGLPAGAPPGMQPGQVGPEVLDAAAQGAGTGGSPAAQRQPGLAPEQMGVQTRSLTGGVRG